MLMRAMLPEDFPVIAALEAQIFSMPWSEVAFRESISQKNTVFLAMELEDGTIAGYCGLYIIEGVGEIVKIAVRESCRRRGYAARLLAELLSRGAAQGAKAFTLEVRKSNTPAIRLYEGLDFVCEGIRPDFYDRPKEDALIMWRR